jgi:hypothetical protein
VLKIMLRRMVLKIRMRSKGTRIQIVYLYQHLCKLVLLVLSIVNPQAR